MRHAAATLLVCCTGVRCSTTSVRRRVAHRFASRSFLGPPILTPFGGLFLCLLNDRQPCISVALQIAPNLWSRAASTRRIPAPHGKRHSVHDPTVVLRP